MMPLNTTNKSCGLTVVTTTQEHAQTNVVDFHGYCSSGASYAEEKNTTIVRTCEYDIREYCPIRIEARFLTT